MRGALLRLVIPLGSVLVVMGACGAPTDPEIPTSPGDDGGVPDTADEAPVVSTCVGAPDGANCGNGDICVSSACLAPQCGDSVVTAPEECDRGSGNAAGSGCETTCKFTCAPNDPARGCKSADPCIADGTCSDTLHTCTAGAPLPAGSACGANMLCAGGKCIAGTCGDGVVTPPEQCDDGSANGPGKGCETDCTFTCTTADTSKCAATPCNVAACSTQHTCSTAPDATKNGTACGTIAGYTCTNGACLAPGAVCGNGVKEGGEDCDFGAQNGAGTGCESTCKFSCATAATCIDANACDQPPTCSPVTVNGMTGQKCVNGAPKADGSACGTGSICIADVCKLSVCGDGVRDDAKGEQCDDSNLVNLDGCDGTCKFEEDQRLIGMVIQYNTDTYCTVNALASVIPNTLFGQVRNTFQTTINNSLKDGTLSALLKMSGDPTGASGAATVGSLSGTPVAGATYNGQADLDWWYTVDPGSIDGTRTALASLTGTYAGGNVDATGTANLLMNIGGSIATLHVSSAKIHAAICTPPTVPTVSSGAPPGHLASEHLSPTLTSFPTMGGARTTPTAEMCGNISANSLANTALPPELLPGGADACNENYSTANRMLDVFVHGCHITVITSQTVINPTQPDQVDPAATPAGAGGPYTLTVDATTKRVNACKDKNGATVSNLTQCLNAAAYSMFLKFATDRVIIK